MGFIDLLVVVLICSAVLCFVSLGLATLFFTFFCSRASQVEVDEVNCDVGEVESKRVAGKNLGNQDRQNLHNFLNYDGSNMPEVFIEK